MYAKPANPREFFTEEEWSTAIAMLAKPKKNTFVPDDTSTLVSTEDQQQKNDKPTEIQLTDDDSVLLYHLVDHVYLKPKSFLDVLLRIRQPEERYNSAGKPVCFLETPKDYALFKVMTTCLEDKVTLLVGYEAELADMTYEITSNEEMAVCLRFSGYASTLLRFAETFITIMLESAKEGGFETS